MIRWMAWAIAGLLKSRAQLVAENLCLRQQLVVLQRRQPRPRLLGADRRFWILARQWFSGWRDVLLIVQPETVLRWHREGWGGLLALALKTAGERRTPPDFSRAEGTDPADGFREPLLGSTTDPSRTGEVRLQGLCPHRSEVYAPALCREAVT